MPGINIEDYVDQEFLDRVNKRAAELASRAHLTAKDLDAAAAQAAAAEKTAAKSPSLENEAALEKADRAFRVAQKLHAAAEQESKAYSDWLPDANGAAYARLYMLGVRARITAAKKKDEAIALLRRRKRILRLPIRFAELLSGQVMKIPTTLYRITTISYPKTPRKQSLTGGMPIRSIRFPKRVTG